MTKEYEVMYWKNMHKYTLTIACVNITDVVNHMLIFHSVPESNIVSIQEVI